MAQIDTLARPPDDPYFEELLDQHQRIRRFLPHFARSVGLGAMPGGQPVLKALKHLQKMEDGKAHGLKMPTDFVPKSWLRRSSRMVWSTGAPGHCASSIDCAEPSGGAIFSLPPA